MVKIAPAVRRRRQARRPDASSLSISQLARAVGEPAHVIRYYCRIGLLDPDRRSPSGYRFFSAGAVDRSRFIRRAQGLGFSLDEIAEIFRHARDGQSPCPQARQIIARRIPHVAEQLDELVALHQRMSRALERWRRLPDQVPTGDEVCALIESEKDDPKPRRGKAAA